MTKREALRQTQQENVLMDLGFTRHEAEQLRRISMTLHRWYERECGDGHGCIERDEDTDKVYWHHADSGRRYQIPDRQRGAERRLAKVIVARNLRTTIEHFVIPYLQTDPRGAALYIIRPGDVPDGKPVESYHNRGICIY